MDPAHLLNKRSSVKMKTEAKLLFSGFKLDVVFVCVHVCVCARPRVCAGEDEDQFEQFMLPLTAAFEAVAQMLSTNTFNEQEAKVTRKHVHTHTYSHAHTHAEADTHEHSHRQTHVRVVCRHMHTGMSRDRRALLTTLTDTCTVT